jgi:hypothetical protein
MPLFRRREAKPNWGMEPARLAYELGRIMGSLGKEPPITDAEKIRAITIDETCNDIRPDLAEHFYSSGYRDGAAEREKGSGSS